VQFQGRCNGSNSQPYYLLREIPPRHALTWRPAECHPRGARLIIGVATLSKRTGTSVPRTFAERSEERKASAKYHPKPRRNSADKVGSSFAKNGTIRIAEACRTRFSASLGSEVPSAFRISLLSYCRSRISRNLGALAEGMGNSLVYEKSRISAALILPDGNPVYLLGVPKSMSLVPE